MLMDIWSIILIQNMKVLVGPSVMVKEMSKAITFLVSLWTSLEAKLSSVLIIENLFRLQGFFV